MNIHSELSDIEDTKFFYQIAYCSVLRRELTVQEIDELMLQARRKNKAQNITGILMMEEGLVIQWLEGEKAEVRKLWAKLLEDQRHHCIVELTQRRFAKERLFPDWSMQRASRQEMVAIVNSAREQAEAGVDTPWAGAISTLCILIDPAYAKAYSATLQSQQVSHSAANAQVIS